MKQLTVDPRVNQPLRDQEVQAMCVHQVAQDENGQVDLDNVKVAISDEVVVLQLVNSHEVRVNIVLVQVDVKRDILLRFHHLNFQNVTNMSLKPLEERDTQKSEGPLAIGKREKRVFG